MSNGRMKKTEGSEMSICAANLISWIGPKAMKEGRRKLKLKSVLPEDEV